MVGISARRLQRLISLSAVRDGILGRGAYHSLESIMLHNPCPVAQKLLPADKLHGYKPRVPARVEFEGAGYGFGYGGRVVRVRGYL